MKNALSWLHNWMLYDRASKYQLGQTTHKHKYELYHHALRSLKGVFCLTDCEIRFEVKDKDQCLYRQGDNPHRPVVDTPAQLVWVWAAVLAVSAHQGWV